MRRHAKASTAGSTQRQAGRLGRFFRGAFATRGALLDVKGSGAPSSGRLLTVIESAPRCIIPAGVLTAFVGAMTLLAVSVTPAAAAECPNEIRRQEQGVSALALPDCRAYENASPGSQPHASGSGRAEDGQASIDGNHILYNSKYPAVGAEHSGQYYVSTRGAGGWSPKTVIPQETPETQSTFACNPGVFFSPDFSKNILEQDHEEYFPGESNAGNPEGFCGRSEELLDPREEVGYRSVLLHDNASGHYELVNVNEDGGAPGNTYVLDASDDFNRVFFMSEAQLTPEAPGVTPNVAGAFNLFVWSGGGVRLATFLPDGTPVAGSAVGNSYEHGTSAAGNRFFFTYGGALYVRLNPDQPPSAIVGGVCTEAAKACTVQVDKSQGPDSSGGGHFEFASDDGSKVFFTSDKKLTADSTAVAGKDDLYEFGTDTGILTDLTVHAGEPAGVWGVTGFSEDGSDVYFIAEGSLAPGALPGSCNHYNEGATCNLYRLHEGAASFIAAVSVDDIYNPFFKFTYNGEAVEPHASGVSGGNGQASPNGHFLVFTSYQSITGYDNVNPDSGNPILELFLYDTATEQLDCVSCPSDSSPPTGFGLEFGPTTWAGHTAFMRENHVLDNGEVFFATTEAVTPADINETSDVYEWSNGEAHLISTGTDPGYSDLVAVTPSGSDVFFITAAGILASDTEGATTMYDARVGGGFPEPPPLPGCEGEACRGAGTNSPPSSGAGTSAFQGPGDQAKGHKTDCGLTARRAQKLSREAKGLRRRANQAGSEQEAKRLRRQAAQLAKQGDRISKNAKRCRHTNRGTGK